MEVSDADREAARCIAHIQKAWAYNKRARAMGSCNHLYMGSLSRHVLEGVLGTSDWSEQSLKSLSIKALKAGSAYLEKHAFEWNRVKHVKLKRTQTKALSAQSAELETLRGEVERLNAIIARPPKHDFWGAGEHDCPRDIKAGNGEIHTLRCKKCGTDNPRDELCRAGLQTMGDDNG